MKKNTHEKKGTSNPAWTMCISEDIKARLKDIDRVYFETGILGILSSVQAGEDVSHATTRIMDMIDMRYGKGK